MLPVKNVSRASQVVKIKPLPEGYAIQVYNQTVMRAGTQGEAQRLADELRRALR